MAALTDGTTAGTFPATPVAPATTPTSAPTVTPIPKVTANNAGTPLTGQPQTAQIPDTTQKSVSVVSAQTGIPVVQKMTNTMNNASAAISTQAANTATPSITPVYDSKNNITGYNKVDATGASTFVPSASSTPTQTPEQQAMNTPETGNQFHYDAQGNKIELPAGTPSPKGYSTTNPNATPTGQVTATAQLPAGTSIKQMADGTYGEYDPSGKYVGTSTAADFQTAQSAQTATAAYDSALNGSYPLTASQQGQIQAAKDAAAKQTEIMNNINANVMGGMSVLMNLRGLSGDAVGLSTMAQNAAAGAQRITDIQNQLLDTVNKMTAAFNKENLSDMKDAYDRYTNASDKLQAGIDSMHANAVAALKEAQTVANQDRTYNLDVQKFNQTKDQASFDNAYKTEAQAFDEKYKTATLAFDKAKFNATLTPGGVPGADNIPSAQMGPTGAPDPATQKQVFDKISAQYGSMTATAIKSLANYEMNPTNWTTRATKTGGMNREQAVTLAKMYDPTYQDGQYAARASYLTGLASIRNGTVGGAIKSANTTIDHLATYLQSVTQMGNKASETINSLLNPLENVFDPARQALATKANTAGQGIADEMTKFFSQSNGDTKQVEAWKKSMSSNNSPGQQQGLAQGAVDLLAGQLRSISEQYATVMGKAPENSLLGPTAMASLSKMKDMGFQVDIPGVLYTDPKAYITSDPAASSKMDAARTALIQANDPNNPPTPENILQLAQLQ